MCYCALHLCVCVCVCVCVCLCVCVCVCVCLCVCVYGITFYQSPPIFALVLQVFLGGGVGGWWEYRSGCIVE